MSGRLLIVDKVAANRVVLRARLEVARHTVEMASDLGAALSTVAGMATALVILDCSIVEDDLATTIARIRTAARVRFLPVIVTCGETDRITPADVLEAGGNDLQRRPILEHLLMARVRSLLRARDTSEEYARRRATAANFGFSESAPAFRAMPRLAIVGPDREDEGPVPGSYLPGWTRCLRPREALGLTDPARAPELLFLPLTEKTAEHRLPLLSELRSRAGTRHVAILALVPGHATRLAAQALDLGASDVADITADKREIDQRLARQLALKREADALRRTIDDGFRAATTDGLTGLYNRRYADSHLRRIHAEAAGGGESYAVILADIDLFKQVNDRHGHAAGDAVLRIFAKRLRCALRGADLLARYGGEEFLAVLPQTDRNGALTVADRLLQVTRRAPMRLPDGTDLRITASFGAAIVPPYVQPEDVLQNADAALYAAKAMGRDQVQVAPPPSDSGAAAE